MVIQVLLGTIAYIQYKHNRFEQVYRHIGVNTFLYQITIHVL